MKLRKDKLLTAINDILKRHDEQRQIFDNAIVAWRAERAADWHRDEKPKWIKLRDLITERNKARKAVTELDVIAIFGVDTAYRTRINFTPFDPDLTPPQSITLRSGRIVKQPSYVDTNHLKAMRKLLEAIEDDYVTDQALSKLGMKNVTPVFRAAVEIGGLIS